jgi:carboxyl-terminal processing protease
MILTLGLGLVGDVALDRLAGTGLEALGAPSSFRLMTEAWGIIRRYYVDRAAAQPGTMTYGAISGMVNALGDTGHSRFLSPLMVKPMDTLERNKFQGIGAEIQLKAGHVIIEVPLDGSPAQRAGLRPGDIITAGRRPGSYRSSVGSSGRRDFRAGRHVRDADSPCACFGTYAPSHPDTCND